MAERKERRPEVTDKELLREHAGNLDAARRNHSMPFAEKSAHLKEIAQITSKMIEILEPFARLFLAIPEFGKFQQIMLDNPSNSDEAKNAKERLTSRIRGFRDPKPLNAIDMLREFGPDLRISPEIDQAYQLLIDLGIIPTETEDPSRSQRNPGLVDHGGYVTLTGTQPNSRRGLSAKEVAERLRALDHKKTMRDEISAQN